MSGLSVGHCISNLITNCIGNSSHFASIHSFIHKLLHSLFFCTNFFIIFIFLNERKKDFPNHESLKDFKQTNKQTTFQTNSSKEINYLWSAIKIGLWAKLWYCKLQLVSFFASYVSFCKLMFLDSGQWPMAVQWNRFFFVNRYLRKIFVEIQLTK